MYTRGSIDLEVFKVKNGKFVSLVEPNDVLPISDTWPFPVAPDSDFEKV